MMVMMRMVVVGVFEGFPNGQWFEIPSNVLYLNGLEKGNEKEKEKENGSKKAITYSGLQFVFRTLLMSYGK